MLRITQMAYVIAVMIGSAAFGLQIMMSMKNLRTDNGMVKRKSTTFFLGLLLTFNLLEYMMVIFDGPLEPDSVNRTFLVENILCVAIACSLVCMERGYAGEPSKKWIAAFFVTITVLLLPIDMTYISRSIDLNVRVYQAVILSLNVTLLTVTSYFCFRSVKIILAKEDNRRVATYLTLCTVFLAALCILSALCIMGARTTYSSIRKDNEIYVIFWTAFNVLNLMMVWMSCKQQKPAVSRDDMVTERIDRLADERGLSSREREIAFLLYKGMTNSEIAEMLFLSTNTIKVHTSNLYRKLGVNTRMQAVGLVTCEGDEE